MAARTRSPARRGKPPDRPTDSSGQRVLSELRQIPVDRIDIPPRPARRFLGDVAGLAESMQDYGLQQPISVRAAGERFALTSGLRRLTAARMLKWTSIAAFVRTVDADQAYLLDLIENLQREDLSPEEEADALGELIRTRGWTLQQVSNGIKRSVGYVSKRVRLFEDPLLRQAVVERGLPISTAEELLGADEARRKELVERAIAEHWDQGQARLALQASTSDGLTSPEDTDVWAPSGRPRRDALPPGRPRGLTRAIREFHELIVAITTAELTPTDRAALRALFRDLQMLARAPTTPRPTVFPELPATRPSSRRRTAASHRSRTRRLT